MATVTSFTVLTQGTVKMNGTTGYKLIGNDDVVCFYIDPVDRGYIDYSSISGNNCPIIYIICSDTDVPTIIEFSEFKGWRFFSGSEGKSIAVTLVNENAWKIQFQKIETP